MKYLSGTSHDEIGQLIYSWFKFFSQSEGTINYYTAIGIYREHKAIGAIIYTNFSHTNVDIHWYMPRCLNRYLLDMMFRYPFIDLGLIRVTGFVNSTNIKAIKVGERLGFEKEAIVKDYYSLSEDMLIYKLTKEKARKWIM